VQPLTYFDSIILGIVEGLTEFLPISSTGHLTIAEQMLGLTVDDKGITAYTAIIQMGAIAATVVYFWQDIVRLLGAWFLGLRKADERNNHDYQLAWAVIVGSIPVAVVGFLARGWIKGGLRSVWVVAAALILWSVVMWAAERRHAVLEKRGVVLGEGQVTMRDGLFIGFMQCFSLIPGVSRSGATISAGLIDGLDRVTATRLSFFMAIPALTAASLYESKDIQTSVTGPGQMIVGIVIAFIVAYASIAWLLKFVAHHPITIFIWYRVALGLALGVALYTGALAAL
jgi:undecaprenyl-diphosphatase